MQGGGEEGGEDITGLLGGKEGFGLTPKVSGETKVAIHPFKSGKKGEKTGTIEKRGRGVLV